MTNFFQQPLFRIFFHLFLALGLLYNSFYLLEGWKINKNNIRTSETNIELQQKIDDIKIKNDYKNLDSYKDKIIKLSGFKKPDEQVIDTSILETQLENEKIQTIVNTKNNPSRWWMCFFGRNNEFETVLTSCR